MMNNGCDFILRFECFANGASELTLFLYLQEIINLKIQRYVNGMNEVNKLKEILAKIAVARLQMQDQLAKMERSECTRKLQIGITNCEQAELWFASAIKELEYTLEQKGYA